MKVKDVMTPTVQTCMPETSLATAAMMMWESDCGVLDLSYGDVMRTFRSLCAHRATLTQQKHARAEV